MSEPTVDMKVRVFDVKSIERLADSLNLLARSADLQVATFDVYKLEDGGIRIAGCAPCAVSEEEFVEAFANEFWAALDRANKAREAEKEDG